MDWSQAQKELSDSLVPLHGQREATLIADWVMEALSGRRRLERLLMKTEPLSPETLATYRGYRDELLAHRPVQYVLRECWFAGMKFFVDEGVLIPRPETEELVEWIARELSDAVSGSLLDVGTGSGCVAVTLAKKLPGMNVHAVDLSDAALAVARRNAHDLDAPVVFHQLDFLDRTGWDLLPPLRWLVSNPPYVPLREKETMDPHVVKSEPDIALFVPDEDALVFYRALGEFAGRRLERGGSLYVEIHEERGPAVRELLLQLGAIEVIIRKDFQGKDRMIKAVW
ncbi:MAG TPA: peptide chain release factor N(5)-glutamine methyltransferase [Puia sp.]|jgi:release factor glutamine methyltransferase|nr:peptide chain release factor N(5)-glutamine methyltransferase [Puia sp.]